MSTNALPTAWKNAEVLDGLDLRDKAELIGTPFKVDRVWFEENDRGVSYAYLDCEDTTGELFTFNDSSSGVRKQIEQHLERTGRTPKATGDVVEGLELVIPRGLRKSEYEVRDERGRVKMAKTYYLTASGRRAVDTDTAKGKK